MGNIKIYQIEKIKFDGKWVEFWFVGNEGEGRSFDKSCKQYMLHAVDYVEDNYINNYGYKGLFVVWVDGSDRPVAMFSGQNLEEE